MLTGQFMRTNKGQLLDNALQEDSSKYGDYLRGNSDTGET